MHTGTSLLTYPGSLNIIELGEGPKDKCTNILENCTLPNVKTLGAWPNIEIKSVARARVEPKTLPYMALFRGRAIWEPDNWAPCRLGAGKLGAKTGLRIFGRPTIGHQNWVPDNWAHRLAAGYLGAGQFV